jgi:hypothetical protein
MTIDLNDAEPQQNDDHFETEGAEVAECFEIDFCCHGHGRLSLFRKGAERPFAVALFGPRAIIDMAKLFAEAAHVEGHA